MTNWLTNHRKSVCDALAKVAPAHYATPAHLDLPMILLGEGAPFVERATWGSYSVALKGILYTAAGDEEVMLEQLDSMIAGVIDAWPNGVVEVSTVEAVTIPDGQVVMSATINCTTLVEVK